MATASSSARVLSTGIFFTLPTLPAHTAGHLTGRSSFPDLVSHSSAAGLHGASSLGGTKYRHSVAAATPGEDIGAGGGG